MFRKLFYLGFRLPKPPCFGSLFKKKKGKILLSWLETSCFRRKTFCLSLDLTIQSVCTRAWKQGSSLHPSHKYQGRAEQTVMDEKDKYLCKEVFLLLFWDGLCFPPHSLLHPPLAPGTPPLSGMSERSISPYRRRVLVDVCAVGQVDEDGVHVLHICDGDCQVGQSRQRFVFILVLEKTRVGGGRERKDFYQKNRIIQQY